MSMDRIIGKTPVKVEQSDERIIMTFSDGSVATWYHSQDCCETVVVDDVVGDWSDLYGHPLLVAEERETDDHHAPAPPELPRGDDSNTWTFYTFRSIGGSVDVRWHGSSNGYYSESVDFFLEEPSRRDGST